MNNKEIVLANERTFAVLLANHVLAKPKLNSWMILIPFIFLFYFQDLSKYKQQRKDFVDNWLLSREKALDEAEKAIDEGRCPDTGTLARQANLKDKVTDKYDSLLDVMARHYTVLLNANGDTYEALVRSAYESRGEFLHFINRLREAENSLNKALLPQLRKTAEDVDSTIEKIEKASENLRRLEIQEIFASAQ